MILATVLLVKNLRVEWILEESYNVLTYHAVSLSRIFIINGAMGFFYTIHIMRLHIAVTPLGVFIVINMFMKLVTEIIREIIRKVNKKL